MTRFSATSLGAEWLANFTDEAERETAAALIDEVLFVGRNTLVRGLRSLIETILHDRKDPEKPIALFAERAVPKANNTVLPFFPNAKSGRATGPGIAPIIVNPADQEVGSEGPIGNLITDLVRYHGAGLLSHPGPDRMRQDRVRHICHRDRFYRLREAGVGDAGGVPRRGYSAELEIVPPPLGQRRGLLWHRGGTTPCALKPPQAPGIDLRGLSDLVEHILRRTTVQRACALPRLSAWRKVPDRLLEWGNPNRIRSRHAQQRAPDSAQEHSRLDGAIPKAKHCGSGNELPSRCRGDGCRPCRQTAPDSKRE